MTADLFAEYLGDSQSQASGSQQSSSLRTALRIFFDGYAFDPRVFTYRGGAAFNFWDTSGVNNEDNSRLDINYDFGISAFSNRAVSVAASGLRTDVDTLGAQTSTGLDGTTQLYRIAVSTKPKRYRPEFELRLLQEGFTPEEFLGRSRETDLKRAEFFVNSDLPRASTRLYARREDSRLGDNDLLRKSDFGQATLSLSATPRDDIFLRFVGQQFEVDRPEFDSTTARSNLIGSLRFTHRFGPLDERRGQLRVNGSRQTSSTSDVTAGATNLGLTFTRRLTRFAWLETGVSQLLLDEDNGDEFSQPRAEIGTRLNFPQGRWSLFFFPRVSYIIADSSQLSESEAAFGWGFTSTASTDFLKGSFTIEANFFGNQLSLAKDEDRQSPGGVSFLSGLATDGGSLQFALSQKLGRDLEFGGRVRARYERRLLLDRDDKLSRNTGVVAAWARWRRISFSLTATQADVPDPEIPFFERSYQSTLEWLVNRWIVAYGRLEFTDRDIDNLTDQFAISEVGFRFQYALFTFYARVRQTSFDLDSEGREQLRYWIGLSRRFYRQFGTPQFR